jgi:hypothetical protein
VTPDALGSGDELAETMLRGRHRQLGDDIRIRPVIAFRHLRVPVSGLVLILDVRGIARNVLFRRDPLGRRQGAAARLLNGSENTSPSL